MKSPSKFTSLEKLEMIKRNNYIGETGNEYVSEEVDFLIMQKQSKKDDEENLKLLKQMEELNEL